MPDSFEFVGFLFTPSLSVCSLRFILTFLSGVSSELSAGDLKHDIEKAQRNDNDGDHNDDGYGKGDQKLDRSPGRGSQIFMIPNGLYKCPTHSTTYFILNSHLLGAF